MTIRRTFRDARNYVPPRSLDFLDLRGLPNYVTVPDHCLTKWVGELKADPQDFVVCEPVPEYPGMPAELADEIREKRRFLTIGPESDMPGLRNDSEMEVSWRGRRVNAVALTVVKTGENTWSVTDALAAFLSEKLGRAIHHDQILTSGLKDKRAWTVQTFVVAAVSMAEMRRVDWPTWDQFRHGGRGYFVKDVRPTDRLIGMGDHVLNGFIITVRVPDKSAAELEEYMKPRALALELNGNHMPDRFHRQRLGPWQRMHEEGETLLTGEYDFPGQKSHPFSSNVEALLHRMVCEVSSRDSDAVAAVRKQMQQKWHQYFDDAESALRRVYRKPGFNMSLEYEIVRRFADNDRYAGIAEAILYDLRSRLSLCIGAVQGYYSNWMSDWLEEMNYVRPGDRRRIPLLMSCQDARDFYSQTELGRDGLAMLATTETLAATAMDYFKEYVRVYWQPINAKREELNARKDELLEELDRLEQIGGVKSKRAGVQLAKLEADLMGLDRQLDALDVPDRDTGLSFTLVREMFKWFAPKPAGMTMARPSHKALSAALVMYMFLTPRDRQSGAERNRPPKRSVHAKVEWFSYKCENGRVILQFALPKGSYATMLISLLFDTTDKRELEVSEELDVGGIEP